MTGRALAAFGRSGVVVCAAMAWLCVARPALAQPATTWGELPLPGGVAAARDVLVLGDAEGRLDSSLLVDVVRRYANTDLRAAADRFERHLATVTSQDPVSPLPLPLPAFWQATLGRGNTPLLVSMLRSRGAMLTYHGLMSLDAGTLADFAGRPALLRDIVNNGTASAAFAAFAAGLRIGDEGVVTPGGADDRALWQSLAGADPADADAFVRALLTRDGGRLAWFYDTVAHLPTATQRFVLMSQLPAGDRAQAVTAIYSRFAAVEPTWRIDTRPFHRPPFDGALALLILDARDDGTIGPSWWPATFDAVTRQADWSTAPPTSTDVTDRPADARWMFEWVFANPDAARLRFAALRFAQRQLAGAPREAALDVIAALGGVLEMPSLMFTLERIGVHDPAIFGEAARAARRVTYSGSEARVRPALARWQIGLGLLEQIQRRAQLPESRIDALVRAWIAVAPIDADSTTGAVAGWFHDHLLPALVSGNVSGAALEEAFLEAATTPRGGRRHVFTWEGLAYAVDDAGASYQTALAIRRARTGPQLHHVVELREVLTEASAARESPPAATRAIVVRLERLASAIAQIDHRDDRRVRDFARMIQSIGGTTGGRLTENLPVVGAALDALTESVLSSLIYALAVAPTTESILYPDAWTRHSLEQPRGVPAGSNRGWRDLAWQFPLDYGLGGGTRLIGAYLGVDVALAGSQLVRVPSETLPVPGAIDDPTRRGLVEQLVVADRRAPAGLPPTLAGDIAAGRGLVDAWIDTPPDEGALRAALRHARIDGWRINTMAWDVSRGHRESLRQLSVTELATLGMNEQLHPGLPTQWSGSSRLVDGCLCLLGARAVTNDQMRGRRLGVQALRPLDVSVRLAELLAALDLDAALVPTLLPMALQDWLDHSRPAWLDDWDAFAAWPRSLTLERVEAYLLHLVSTGIFSPPSPGEMPR